MRSVLKTPPAKLPIELKEAKQHLNLPPGWTEDDEVLKAMQQTATKKVEQFLRRRLITQTWYAYYDNWPHDDSIILPFGQLQSVTSVKYTNTAGTQTTWSTDEYNTDTDRDPGRVIQEYGYPWPDYDLHPQNPIVIEFVCGYGNSGSDVEDMIRHAIKLTIDDLYNNRGDVLIGISAQNLKVVGDLLWPYRIHERPTQ